MNILVPYPTFDDISDPKLRAWNRLNVIFNLKENVHNNASTDYAKQFDKEGKFQIILLSSYIVKHGYENTRREIFREEYA
jgi:hypothetical protein